MKILGICASHRNGGTYRLLEEAMKGTKEEDQTVDTKIIELAGLKIGSCITTCAYDEAAGCAKQPFECNVKDDLQMVLKRWNRQTVFCLLLPAILLCLQSCKL